ncbi:MAG: hypothetical protein A3F12_00350 [Gammaproteobacteria bacterium RIFCSPHIGHO2_12_FULL_38_14]|nr:MAG: hypothetical protein A3F12_00350 [Gammaproteobacteria bacterium RIFCSPHIGHO2_12_FULL_38_14]
MKQIKKILLGSCATLLSVCNIVYAESTQSDSMPATASTTQSYAMGYKTGQALKAQSVSIDSNAFTSGLNAGYQGQQPMFSEQVMQSSLADMQTQMVKKMQNQYQKEAKKNEKEGQAFLLNNAKSPGVQTTSSGLQYQIITEGSGDSPALNDTVTVNYEGKLINGKVFDSSYQRGTPATFKVGDVIPGWQEALLMMKPGATWMLYIPSNLAYGKQGSQGTIGPNEVLIFKVELLAVKRAG